MAPRSLGKSVPGIKNLSAPPIAAETDLHITKLPMEILIQLPHFLDNLDDLYALLSTSRLFHRACFGTSAKLPVGPKTDVRLALAGTARQVADWASRCQPNNYKLRNAFENGQPGLQRLAYEVARLSLEEIRVLHVAKRDVIQPLAVKLKQQCVSCEQGKFYRKHCTDFSTALWDFVIYCELFHHNISSAFYKTKALRFASSGANMRRYWVEKSLTAIQVRESESLPPTNHVNLSQLRNVVNLFRCRQPDYTLYTTLRHCAANLGRLETLPQRGGRNAFYSFMEHQGLSTLRMVLHEDIQHPTDSRLLIDALDGLNAAKEAGVDGASVSIGRSANDWESMRDDLNAVSRSVYS